MVLTVLFREEFRSEIDGIEGHYHRHGHSPSQQHVPRHPHEVKVQQGVECAL